jgi:hypothetical protein
MTLLLRKSSEGWTAANWGEDDYVSSTTAMRAWAVIGRIYKEMIHGEPKWLWFLQQIPEVGPGRPIPPPKKGIADTLDEAKGAFARRYEEVKWGK